MATISMIPVGPVITLNRSIVQPERAMSGTGGDDFICGHCGSVVLEDFDPSTVTGNPVYQCPICQNNNDLPFAANDSRHWSPRRHGKRISSAIVPVSLQGEAKTSLRQEARAEP